jgi:hypothetical protein
MRKWKYVTCLYSSLKRHNCSNIIRVVISMRMRLAGHVAHVGKMKNAYRFLFGKPEGERPCRRPRHKWEDNIRMVVREIGWEGVDWMHLAQDRDQWQALVNKVMNLRSHKRQGFS